MKRLWVPVSPIAKQRARMSPKRRGKKSKVYTPFRTAHFEQEVADWWKENGPEHFGEGPISMDIQIDKAGFWVTIKQLPHSRRPVGIRGDVDNYAKSIQDALNTIAYMDDRQIEDVRVRFVGAQRVAKIKRKVSEDDGEG